MFYFTRKRFLVISLLILLSSIPLLFYIDPNALAAPNDLLVELVSISSTDEQGDEISTDPSISADGRFVAFYSMASNLVSGDTNFSWDVFVHDRQTGETERVSLSSSDEQGDDYSIHPSISADGRFVAFYSAASNLVSGDTNGKEDIFVYDRQTGETERISLSSSNGQGNNSSDFPSISADGRFVAFASAASNLVSGDTNETWDIFVRDRLTGETERVSLSSSGKEGIGGMSRIPSISADGRFVAFGSYASNLVIGDTNGQSDIFVRDRQTGETERVSLSSSGEEANNGSYYQSSISTDGRFVAFSSLASNLVTGDTNEERDVFVHDRQTGETERVSLSSSGEEGNNGAKLYLSTSADGRFVAFSSLASNLVSGDTNGKEDIFVHDRQTGETERVSLSSSGEEGNNFSSHPSISADGRFVAFGSFAFNLVVEDTNGQNDVFVRDRSGTWDNPRTWTIMYYQAWDNDINHQLDTEIENIRSASNNQNIYITVFRDTLSDNAVIEAYNDGELVHTIAQGEVNTGEANTLGEFINWSQSNYPADHYALVIVDHGHGLSGVALDETSNNNWLNPQELRSALQTGSPLDILYFEACLVANLEYAYQARDLTDYYIASESRSKGPRNPDDYLRSVSSQTQAVDLALDMAQDYYEQYQDFDTPLTISIGDMSKIEIVAQTTNDFADSIRSHRLDLGIAMWDIITGDIVQRFDENGDDIIDENDQLADLYHFAQLVGWLGEPDLESSTDSLTSAIDDYIIFNSQWGGSLTTGDHSNAHGLSIALPRNLLCYYDSDWFDFAGEVSWFCDNHTNTSTQEIGDWGNMLAELIVDNNPNPSPIYEPPTPIPLLISMHNIYLPALMNR